MHDMMYVMGDDKYRQNHMYVHYSAIESKEVFKTICKHDLVEFTIYSNLYSKQVDSCKILEPDFDYMKVNTCLEMMFERGIDISAVEPRYK